jgi:hypothetical protein
MDIKLLELAIGYIKPELTILLIVLTYLGTLLKKTPTIEDWKIPFWLMAVSVALATSYTTITTENATLMAVWVGIVQGLVIAAVQSTGYTMYKQSKKRT